MARWLCHTEKAYEDGSANFDWQPWQSLYTWCTAKKKFFVFQSLKGPS